MNLTQLLDRLEGKYSLIKGGKEADRASALDTEVRAITNDSRKIEEGTLFFCIIGANSDGHDFASEAVNKGALVLVVSKDVDLSAESLKARDIVPVSDFEKKAENILLVKVDNTRYAMAFISAAYYGHPAESLKTIGITGTKGKTTTTYLIKSILESSGKKVGLVGTIETIIGDKHIPSANTTPESIVLQRTFREMVDAGIEVVVMEVSSQALMQHRSQGFIFDIGVFTNISPDHIGPNEHTSFEDYMQCKGLLFRQCRLALVNGDDEHTPDVLKGATAKVLSFGLKEKNDYRAVNPTLIHNPGELGISFDVEGKIDLHVSVPTPGKFSVYNALSAIAVCDAFNVDGEKIRKALRSAHVKGRIEMVKVSDDFTLMIDYAHNAVALESLLTTLREYEPHRLVTLFGCGGNRSKLRRFEMGEVSGNLSDFTIITSDNPRFEEPLDIIHDIETGIGKTKGKYIEIPDRKEAIRYAIVHGEPGDIIVLAGKGHEDYQEIKGKKYPMDERVIIAEILEEEGKR